MGMIAAPIILAVAITCLWWQLHRLKHARRYERITRARVARTPEDIAWARSKAEHELAFRLFVERVARENRVSAVRMEVVS